jgi:flagellar basal-body rod protein FlgG
VRGGAQVRAGDADHVGSRTIIGGRVATASPAASKRKETDGLMLEGLYSAAAGMSAQQQQLDAISNDLANINTNGYQSQRVAFNDLLYNKVDIAGTESTDGSGANAEFVGRSQTQGAMRETGDPLDVAIEGHGYIEVTLPSGQTALTRDGALGVDASGTIVNSQGHRLAPPIKLPPGVSPSHLSIAADGTVTAGGKKLGQIRVVTVTSPGHLASLGGNLFGATTESGEPHATGEARLLQGALEQSNVDMATDMATMVSTQRAFQMDSSAIQLENQMMTIANQLRA